MLTCSTTTCQISPAYPKFIEKLRRMIWGREPSTSYEFDELAQQVALKSHRRNVDDGYYVEEIHFEPPQVVRKKQPTRNLFYKRSHKKTASVQALTDVQLWVLDRSVFQMITQRLGMERHSQLMNFLTKVSIFQNLSEDRISKMADVMDQDYYDGGHYIIRQGEKVSNPADVTNFDNYPPDNDVPPDEFSGWDEGF
ncbi:cGMP-dependent protein kinase egl-4 [Caenorhabditis elegans]|uniref:Isoform d of cGMP-dependent protein kinase egl-4 n=1 Tax=Caenorhabditis elegans TaxID=6239 RepID=O76360-4|nr:cGMP-dependent protein kinase egl-4 [Caenorhabditis elegans]CCD71862.1 cGMP-dependent protein kinase egl-4 [Caenorhabditis elegans]|eukprot:NP_741330.2 cGMP-dependent protein kinase egl-4 [Caenorhabditis elegans]